VRFPSRRAPTLSPATAVRPATPWR